MPIPKTDVDRVAPCEFYTPGDLFDPGELYTIPEIARLLQGLEPDDALDPETESVLIDWAVPWVMVNAADLVVGVPGDETDPGYYGLRVE